MPNAKQNRQTRVRREPDDVGVPSCAVWMLRELAPVLHRLKPPRTQSTKHLRSAAIEVLEAMRVVLGETIEWLRKDPPREAGAKRIRVEG